MNEILAKPAITMEQLDALYKLIPGLFILADGQMIIRFGCYGRIYQDEMGRLFECPNTIPLRVFLEKKGSDNLQKEFK